MPKYIIGQDFWKILPDYRTGFITINRFVKRDGTAVMGRGIAWQATQRNPGIAMNLGYMLRNYPNKNIYYITRDHATSVFLGGFVVKNHWMHDASLSLITTSCKELAAYASTLAEDENILLNYPGIGNGRLRVSQVQPILDEYLPDNVHVVRKEKVADVYERGVLPKEPQHVQRGTNSSIRGLSNEEQKKDSVLQATEEIPELEETEAHQFLDESIPMGE